MKIEPHSNGPLFVEIHCLINAAKKTDEKSMPPGMPEYIASGSHYFRNTRYRFLVLPRYDCDLHSLIQKNRRVNQKSILILTVQILDILQHLHDKGYCHSDIKAENLMIAKCTFKKSTAKEESSSSSSSSCSGNSSDDEFVDETLHETDEEREEDDDDEDYDLDNTNHKTPKRKKRLVQYSGSNPVSK